MLKFETLWNPIDREFQGLLLPRCKRLLNLMSHDLGFGFENIS